MHTSDSSPATIRRALPDDLPALGRLGALLVQMHHDLDPKRFIPGTPRTEQAYAGFFEKELERPSVLLLVAERNAEVIGYIYAEIEGQDYMTLRGPAGVLHDIVVDSDRRGAGIGQMLLDAAILELERRGVRQVVLSTAERNSSARRFLTRAGFRPTMIEMTRDLPGDAS